ncbi:MAG: ABC transporter permease [Dokdonella sp.]
MQSCRMLAARPGFALAVVLTFALGIGANSAIFSLINGLLLKPLPYADSVQLVYIYNSYPKMNQETSGMTVPDYIDRRDQADALADSALYYDRSFNLAGEGAPRHLTGIVATPSLFTTLKVNAALGRTFSADEAEIGHDHVVILTDSLWKNQFAADATIIGRDVRLNGDSYRVIGVMPSDFSFPNRDVQLWAAFAFTPMQKSDAMRGFDFARSIGRLKPGASIAQLDAQFDAIAHRNAVRLAGTGGDTRSYDRFMESSGFAGRSKSLHDRQTGDVKPLLWTLQAVAFAVLLIACANIANLMLLRVSSRRRELALRSALGAGRARIAQQVLMESLLLALLGGALGIVVAEGGLHLVHTLDLDGAARGFRVDIGGVVLAITAILTLASALLSGLLPALSLTRTRPSEVLKDGARGGVGSRFARTTRDGLVIAQIALAAVLLVGTGLLIHSFALMQRQSPGFQSNHVLSASVHLPPNRYKNSAAAAPFHERLLADVRALPGVTSAGIVGSMLFANDDSSAAYYVEGRDVSDAQPAPLGYLQTVDEDFFKTLQIPLLQGRGFRASDDANSEKVVIVDELLAQKYFPQESALGKRIAMRGVSNERVWQTIIGVVGTVKRNKLDEDTTTETFYENFRQNPTRLFTLVMKTELPAAELIGPLHTILQKIDPEQPVFDIKTMDERIGASLDDRRTPMLLMILFAGCALLLAAVGIHGVLAFSVAQRSGEIGVRMSLGAQQRDITQLVLAYGGRLAGIGLLAGLSIASLLAQSLRTQLFGIDVTDPLTLVAVIAVTIIATLLACWLPARRAARIAPMEALRHE